MRMTAIREAAYPLEAGEGGLSVDELRAATADEQLAAMATWFETNYEDPAQQTPYESKEGGYIYIWGGPYDAQEEIGSEFGEIVPEEVIERAVRHVERDGIYDWAPVDHGEPELSDEEMDAFIDAASDEVVNGDGVWPPIVPAPAPPDTLEDAVRDLRERLDVLERLIEPLAEGPPGIGHNNPPSRIEDSPIDSADGAALRDAVVVIRAQTHADVPDPNAVREREAALLRIARKIGTWLGERATKAIDAAVKVAVGAVGVHTLLDPAALRNAAIEVAEAAERWLQSLGSLI